MNRLKRMAALLICIGFALVLFASSACIAHEADHDCTGEHCEICENIARIEALLQSFALPGAVLLLFTLLSFLHALRAEETLRACLPPTPVGWKVRLND